MVALVENPYLIERPDGSPEDRSIERVDRPVVLTVHAQCRVELRLFDHDVRKAALLCVSADADVEVVFQGAKSGIGERDIFTAVAVRGFRRILRGNTGTGRCSAEPAAT